MGKMGYEQLVEECKRLRLKGERAVAEFFAFLMIAEREHEEVWRGGGYSAGTSIIQHHLLAS